MKTFKDFQEQFPELYENVYCGFGCPGGWIGTVWELSSKLSSQARCHQVKEKFGILRYYLSGTKEDREIVHQYESKTKNICEVCGNPGVLRQNSNGWYHTLCDDDSKGSLPVEDPYMKEYI